MFYRTRLHVSASSTRVLARVQAITDPEPDLAFDLRWTSPTRPRPFRCVLLLWVILVGGVASAADDQAIVTKIVAEQLKADPSAVGLDAPLSAVGKGADPLDVIEIHMAIESTLHIAISDKTVEGVIGSNKTDDYPSRTTVRKLTQMVSISRRKNEAPNGVIRD